MSLKIEKAYTIVKNPLHLQDSLKIKMPVGSILLFN